MCGIAGVAGEQSTPWGLRAAPAMLAAIAHRGPDGEGLWADRLGACVLAHKRLAIIDPEGGAQPLSNEDSTIWITFNGCIYNYRELRSELETLGHRFRTHCDTETIIHAYEQWGTNCVTRFNGMWAFAIWDGRSRTLFCSRDRIGVKPFYYYWDGKRFVFASEIKAILASGALKGRVDAEGLRQYLSFQFCLGETTLFEGIRKLEPGHNLVLRPRCDPKVEKYWDISFELDTDSPEEYFVERIRELVEDAVRLRLRSDVPLGAHLSGGLDSSTIVMTASRLLGREFKTFTGAFEEGKDYDETGYARITAKAANTRHFETFLTPEDFVSSIDKIIYHMDEPAAGPGVFPQYYVSKLASENVKVVLGGQGGDEIFIGYARYLVAYLEECLRGAIEDTAHRSRYVATLESIVPSLPSLERYVPMLRGFWNKGLFDEPARRYYRLMDRFSDTKQLLSADIRVDHERTFEEFEACFNSHAAAAKINRIMNFDLKGHLQSLLHVEDRTSMAHGLESRVPLIDHRLVELMASIPPVTKFKNGRLKYLFRKAVAPSVPRKILDRKDKMGFPVPLSRWASKELKPF
ncbi:MAG: asparagine synthase (glutamine-hydrolyzing), partial [Planctomycetes bacterium]|nr:asparagine synthase (glutamine-hydrolyzing) [Planctomycetota bacterium]